MGRCALVPGRCVQEPVSDFWALGEGRHASGRTPLQQHQPLSWPNVRHARILAGHTGVQRESGPRLRFSRSRRDLGRHCESRRCDRPGHASGQIAAGAARGCLQLPKRLYAALRRGRKKGRIPPGGYDRAPLNLGAAEPRWPMRVSRLSRRHTCLAGRASGLADRRSGDTVSYPQRDKSSFRIWIG